MFFSPARQHPDSDDNTTAGTSLHLLFAHQEAQKSTWDVGEVWRDAFAKLTATNLKSTYTSAMKSQGLPD